MSLHYELALKQIESGVGVPIPEGGTRQESLPQSLKESLYDSVPLLFTPTEGGMKSENWEEGQVIDLPFRTCWFEIIGTPIATADNEKSSVATRGLFVHENTPGDYTVVAALNKVGDLSPRLVHPVPLKYFPRGSARAYGDMKFWWLGIVANLVTRLNNSKAVGTTTGKRKLVTHDKETKKRTKRIINQAIIITGKKSARDSEEIQSIGRPVAWDHRWQVRGHWRRLSDTKSIGKDRNNERICTGFTWIKPFFKGPEDQLLVKKDRVIV